MRQPENRDQHAPFTVLHTDRLLLRPWRESDRRPFAHMNADAEVMRHFPSTLTAEQSGKLADWAIEHPRRHGFGPWAVEIPRVAPFIGFTGLSIPSFSAAFMPCVEIGWRIDREYWGRGYATEAAKAALAFGFNEQGLREIVSFTVPENTASRRVMEKIGMTRRMISTILRFRRSIRYGVMCSTGSKERQLLAAESLRFIPSVPMRPATGDPRFAGRVSG